ncbi:MAG: O-antigen ligase family protein [Sporichthyaceae bacterium]|nr:O-antigen ligase family protein [Sporichthyaceae bacterium]
MTALLLALGLAVVLAASLAVLEVLIRRAEVGAALVLGVTVFKAALVESAPTINLPGGVAVQLHDIVFALLLAAGLARLLRVSRLATLDRWLLVLGALLLLALGRGVATFGLQPAVAEFRLYSPFISTAVYFASFPPSRVRYDRIGRIWLAATVPMLLLILLRWVQNLGGVNLGVPAEQFGGDTAFRVVNGPYGFFVATSVMLTVPFWQRHGTRARKLTGVGALLLLFVVLLNRRTVWVALLAGAAVVVLRDRRRLGHRTLLLLVAAGIVTVGAFLAFPGAGSESATNPLSTGTLDWRIQGWSKLVQDWSRDPVEWIIGQPFGSGFHRVVQGTQENSDAHNFYLTTMLRTGVVGSVALLVVTAGLLRRLWRVPVPGPGGREAGWGGGGLLAPSVFPALLVTQLIWYLTWIPGNEQGIVTGLALALAAPVRAPWLVRRPRRVAYTGASGRVPARGGVR